MTSTVGELDRAHEYGVDDDDRVEAFCRDVVAEGTRVRLPALLRTPPSGALLHQRPRHGVAVVAAPTTSLPPETVAGLLRFRLAQYLDIGFIDRRLAFQRTMCTEPASVVAPGDIHLIAGVPATGEVLCYAVLEQPPATAGGCRLRSADRPLYPVEKVHGAGLYQRLPILPDLPVAKVRELGRFVKNQHPTASRDLVVRAVAELGTAVFRLIAGPLRLSVDAVIGDLEEHVAKQNLDFFHVPSVVIRGTVPYQPSASYLYPRYQLHAVHPFACLASDLSTALPRLHVIEEALAKPGKLAMVALLRLKMRRDGPAASMLHPDPDGHLLAELRLPQLDTAMDARNRLLQQGAQLRQCEVFAPLSVAEAAMLCTLMDRIDVPAGHTVVRQGEPGDALYLVEAGQGRLEVTDSGGTVAVGPLDAGDCCGHLALLAETNHCASVVAATDMTLLRLSKQAHDTYLAGLPDIGGRLSRHALRQWAELERYRRTRPPVADNGCACGDTCACLGHNHDHREEPTP